MKKLISLVMIFVSCLTLLFSLSGCQKDNEALIANITDTLKNTYWSWIDTSPTDSSVKAYCYAYINADGTCNQVSYRHKGNKIIGKFEYGESNWEIIIHRGKPCVKLSKIINEREDTDYILIDIDNEDRIENLYKNMNIPGDRYYDENDSYVMTELTQENYNAVIADEEEQLEEYNQYNSNNNTSGSFTNKYGTKTTKCAHSGCNNYIASSGDTNCCIQHSRRCLNCYKYIDEDAMYCMSCISSALEN